MSAVPYRAVIYRTGFRATPFIFGTSRTSELTFVCYARSMSKEKTPRKSGPGGVEHDGQRNVCDLDIRSKASQDLSQNSELLVNVPAQNSVSDRNSPTCSRPAARLEKTKRKYFT